MGLDFGMTRNIDYPHPDYDYSTDDYNDFEYQQNQAEQIIINGDYD